MPSGVVRAYNVRSGELVWRFNTIPQEGEYGSDTWEEESWRSNGGANVWSTMTRVLDVDGVPCNRPPWGTLTAIDLNLGEIRWQVPVGELDGVKGLVNFGPPLLTASGLLFHAGTEDQRLWVYDELPAGLHAGPITYKLAEEGKQFLVVAPGGHRILGSKSGDYIIAYALPD
jgi:glucose dehydrogenase